MAKLNDINVKVGADIADFQKQMARVERDLRRSGRRMQRLGEDLTATLTLPLAAAGAASLKFATDFERSFTKINTLVGVSGDQLDQFREGIGQLSSEVAQSQTDLSDALFAITSAGQRGAAALDTLEQASKASAIGLGETVDIARAAVAATTAYGEANLSTGEAIDKLTAIVREGNLEASELAPRLGQILPIASQLGVSFDEVGANIATFTRLGVSAGESVTGLKSLLSSLVKPSKDAEKAAAELGISFDDIRKSVQERGLAATLNQLIEAYDGNVTALSRLFPNVEGLVNALGTAGAQGEDYVKIVDSIRNSNGLVNESFETVSETADFKLRKSLIQLQNVGIQLGSVLVPVVTDLLDAVAPLIGAFDNLDDSTKRNIVAAAALAASAGPLLKVFGTAQVVAAALTANYTRLAVAYKRAQVTGLKLTAVQKGLVAVGLAVATYKIVEAFQAANAELNANAVANDRLTNLYNSVNVEIAKQTGELKVLRDQLKDTNLSEQEREQILKRIDQLAPGVVSNLKSQKDGYIDLAAGIDVYIAAQERALKAELLNERKKEIFAALADDDSLGEIDGIQGAFLRLVDVFNSNDVYGEAQARIATNRTNALNKELSEVNSLLEDLSLLDEIISPTLVKPKECEQKEPRAGTLQITPTGTGGSAAPARNELPAITNLLPSSGAVTQIATEFTSLNEALNTLGAIQPEINDSFKSTNQQLTELGVSFEEGLVGFDQYVDRAFQLQDALTPVQSIALQMAESLSSASASGAASLAELGNAAIRTGRQIVTSLIREGVAAAIANTLKGPTGLLGPIGVGIAGAAGAAAAGLFNTLLSGLGVPFAEGGLVYGPTLGLVGEYPGARNNPEVIAPLDKLRSMLGDAGGGPVQVYGRLSGKDILLSSNRAATNLNRKK